MKFGSLADLFRGVGAKYLTAVEIDRQASNQHEFQGVGGFKTFLGTPADKVTLDATFLWLDDHESEERETIEAFCTWSDVRRNTPGRTEYHLYYSSDSRPIVHRASPGDLLVIAQKENGSLLVIICPGDSTIAGQIKWLFGLDLIGDRPVSKMLTEAAGSLLSYTQRRVLEAIGIEAADAEPDAFEQLVATFGAEFPRTAEFSAFARNSLPEIEPRGDPDAALLAWMEQEEALFRHMERLIVSERLTQGFEQNKEADVDGFLKFSLSVQNRRKSRAGYAFGHHVEAILKAHDVRYKREATTEKRNAADFLFPGESEYEDPGYPDTQLRMLAVKTTCKDRWRQVLAEADRISPKHLLTLEPAISVSQTEEMKSQSLELVLPKGLHSTFKPEQSGALISVKDFLSFVR